VNEEAMAHWGAVAPNKKNLHTMTLSSGDFYDNSCSERHILLKGGVKFVPFCMHFSPAFD
jgi:hypothetical protein